MDLKKRSSLFVFLHYMLGFHNLTCQTSGSFICERPRRNEQTKKKYQREWKGTKRTEKLWQIIEVAIFPPLVNYNSQKRS